MDRPRKSGRSGRCSRLPSDAVGRSWCRNGAPYWKAFLALAERNSGSKISAICALARRTVPMLLTLSVTPSFARSRSRTVREDVWCPCTREHPGTLIVAERTHNARCCPALFDNRCFVSDVS